MATWLVESYWPTAAGSPDSAADRFRRTAGEHARLIGVVQVPADELALWRVDAPDVAMVELACRRAEIPFGRIVEIVDIPVLDPGLRPLGEAVGSPNPS